LYHRPRRLLGGWQFHGELATQKFSSAAAISSDEKLKTGPISLNILWYDLNSFAYFRREKSPKFPGGKIGALSSSESKEY